MLYRCVAVKMLKIRGTASGQVVIVLLVVFGGGKESVAVEGNCEQCSFGCTMFNPKPTVVV